LYLKSGRGNDWAEHVMLCANPILVVKADVSDDDENLGAEYPIGSVHNS
jgi:hypothetical protein